MSTHRYFAILLAIAVAGAFPVGDCGSQLLQAAESKVSLSQSEIGNPQSEIPPAASQPHHTPAARPRSEPVAPVAPTGQARIVVDNGQQHQVMEGFGATTGSGTPPGDDVMGAMRPKIMDAVYSQVKLNMGDIHCGPYEGRWDKTPPDSLPPTSADNDDPDVFDWKGWNWQRSDDAKARLVDIAGPMGFDDYMLRGGINTRWGDKWLAEMRTKDRDLYLRHAAKNAVAILIRWRTEYKIVPRWHQLFNEPTTGNHEVAGANAREVVDLVKACGSRFRKEGFRDIKMAVPSEETEESSLAMAKAILADPDARQYVGAIAYHTYPYGSIYCDIGRILATSGSGRPDPGRIKVRNEIRDLAKKHGLQVWMTEVSHGNADAFDTLRGRAIHIHDELLYADASSYWAMGNVANTRAVRSGAAAAKSEDSVVTFDPRAGTFQIRGIGYAIGHYARWISRGAVRLEAASDNPLVQVTAFRDDARGTLVLVLINNEPGAVRAKADLKGLGDKNALRFEGEQSTRAAFWAKIKPFDADSADSASIELPAQSVTTISARRAVPTTNAESAK